MGAAGTDAALQSADVALMSDDLARLPGAVTGARRAARALNGLRSAYVRSDAADAAG